MIIHVILIYLFVVSGQSQKERNQKTQEEYKVKVNLLHYHNPTSRLIAGRRCEMFHFFNDRCDPFADIKIFENNRMIHHFRSKIYHNTNYVHYFDSFSFGGKALPNSIMARVQLWDSDINKDELMMKQDKIINFTKEMSSMVEFENKYAKLTVQFEVLYSYTRMTTTRMTTKTKNLKPNNIIANAKKSVQKFSKNNELQESNSHWTTIIVLTLVGTSLFLLLCFIIVIRKYQRMKRTTEAVISYHHREHEQHVYIGNDFGKSKVPFSNDKFDDDNIYETSE